MPKQEGMKPTHGPKRKGLHNMRPGVGQGTETGNPTTTITHKHERKESVERDCTKCKYATQVSDTEWECSRETYFPQTLLCFAARE